MTTPTLLLLAAFACSRPVPPAAGPTPEAVPGSVSASNVSAGSVHTGSVKPGINDNFLDPQLDVDQWVQRFGAESREVVARQPAIVAAMDLQPGEVVADVGAGTGLYMAPFAQAVGEQGRVYAVDISPGFLEHLDAMATQAGLSQVVTVQAGDRSSNLPEGQVDAVFICDTYHHFEYPAETMASIHAALKPGGRLFVVDFIREEGVSRDWIMDHVRAGQEVFAAEIEAAGFSPGVVLDVGLAENYMLRFDKAG